jgi:biopolymer transport protein ExbD
MAGGAKGYQDEGGDEVISDINVTPLVDIVLVLLIIFMVTARLINARGVEVDSPKTVSGAEISGTVELTIRPGPELYLNGERVTGLAAISAYVTRAVAGDPELRPIITADAAVPHGQVMTLIDTVKQAGVKRFAMTTAPKTDE